VVPALIARPTQKSMATRHTNRWHSNSYIELQNDLLIISPW
jgi:hypothetical protein